MTAEQLNALPVGTKLRYKTPLYDMVGEITAKIGDQITIPWLSTPESKTVHCSTANPHSAPAKSWDHKNITVVDEIEELWAGWVTIR